MDLKHRCLIVDGHLKCIVCWYYIGENKPYGRCTKCVGFNRTQCRGCAFAIKIPCELNVKDNYFCEYCNGYYERLNDLNYQSTDDYRSKFMIRQSEKNDVTICSNCCTHNIYDEIFRSKCDMCSKYNDNCAQIDRDDFMSLKLVNGKYQNSCE